jgi:hypothetical protein
VKKRWQLPEGFNKVIRKPGERERVAIEAHLAENFLVLHTEPEYVLDVANAAKNPAQKAAWLYGDWNVTTGGMIDDIWDHRYHIIQDLTHKQVPAGWTLTRAYDHGQSAPFSVGWWLESNGEPIELPDGKTIGSVRGDLILWKEWYGCELDDAGSSTGKGLRMASRKIARGIIDREEDAGVKGHVLAGPADTEIFNKISDRDGRAPSDDMEDEGVEWERADKSPGSRKRGWEMLRTRLEDALPQGPEGLRENPGLFICAGCRHWIELVPPMPRDEKDLDEVPDKYEDHAGDMTRYRLRWEISGMSRRSF